MEQQLESQTTGRIRMPQASKTAPEATLTERNTRSRLMRLLKNMYQHGDTFSISEFVIHADAAMPRMPQLKVRNSVRGFLIAEARLNVVITQISPGQYMRLPIRGSITPSAPAPVVETPPQATESAPAPTNQFTLEETRLLTELLTDHFGYAVPFTMQEAARWLHREIKHEIRYALRQLVDRNQLVLLGNPHADMPAYYLPLPKSEEESPKDNLLRSANAVSLYLLERLHTCENGTTELSAPIKPRPSNHEVTIADLNKQVATLKESLADSQREVAVEKESREATERRLLARPRNNLLQALKQNTELNNQLHEARTALEEKELRIRHLSQKLEKAALTISELLQPWKENQE